MATFSGYKRRGQEQAIDEAPQDISFPKQKEANKSWMAQVLITMTKTIKLERRQKLIKVTIVSTIIIVR